MRTGTECDDPDEGAAGALVPGVKIVHRRRVGAGANYRVMTVSDLPVLKRFSRAEGLTGIEPALSAWEW